MEQLEPGGPALGPPGEVGQGLGGQRFLVEVPEEAFDLPGPEPQVLGGDLQELARDLETREVEPGWAARRGQHRQRRRGAVHQPLECLLGLTALQHVEVVDEQQQPVDPGALDPLHDAFDAGVDGRAAQRRGNGRTNMVQERRGMSLRHLDPAPRDRHLGRQSELHEQRGLPDPAGATTRPGRRSFSLSRLSFRRDQQGRQRDVDLRRHHRLPSSRSA